MEEKMSYRTTCPNSVMGMAIMLLALAVPVSGAFLDVDELGFEPTYMVTFDREVSLEAARDIVLSSGMETINTIDPVRIVVAKPHPGVDAATAIFELDSYPEVRAVERNEILKVFFEPNDPLYGDQYGMMKIRASDAWEIEYGSSDVVVAIVDTGAKLNHPDLEGQFWVNEDEIPNNDIDDDANGYVDDVYGYDFRGDGFLPPVGKEDSDPSDDTGHGTHCAGIVAAATNNGIGVVGVAPGVKIMPVRALGGIIGFGHASDILDAVVYAVDNGAHVISMSYGGGGTSTADLTTYKYAHDAGVVLVAASGNSGMQGNPIMWPAAHPYTAAIGATNSYDLLAYFSSYGPHLEASAPGANIMSTVCGYLGFGQDYLPMSGTSMACPHVSGLAGLLISQNPALSRDAVRLIIDQTGVDLGPDGWDEKFGHGRIDAYEALIADEPDMSVPHLIMPPDGAIPFQSATFGFKWSEVPEAAAYKLNVKFPNGAHYSLGVSGSVFFPPANAWAGLGAGDYTWEVEARDSSGGIISVSDPSVFTLN